MAAEVRRKDAILILVNTPKSIKQEHLLPQNKFYPDFGVFILNEQIGFQRKKQSWDVIYVLNFL